MSCGCSIFGNTDTPGVALDDVRAAIAAANPGDTVTIPSGSATWDQALVIDKGINLVAADAGGTTIMASRDFKGTYLITYKVLNAEADDPFRLSGFVLDSGARSQGISLINSSITPVTKIRIDHCTFQNFPKGNTDMIWIDGQIYGVVDNCTFNADDGTNTNLRLIRPYGRISDGGAMAWRELSYEFGSANNLYFEDNTFNVGSMICTNGGAGRYAFRHNTINVHSSSAAYELYAFDVHGNMGSGGNWSGFGCEIYENIFNTAGHPVNLLDLRGGKALIYNNNIFNGSKAVEAKCREEHSDSLNPPASSLVNGQPQHVSDFYIWSNFRDGVKVSSSDLPWVQSTITYAEEGVVPRENVHFWREVSNFDGSTGMGIGPISSRPASCVLEGAAWWANDESRLYRWHNGAWELYYTPYTYPHPLRSR